MSLLTVSPSSGGRWRAGRSAATIHRRFFRRHHPCSWCHHSCLFSLFPQESSVFLCLWWPPVQIWVTFVVAVFCCCLDSFHLCMSVVLLLCCCATALDRSGVVRGGGGATVVVHQHHLASLSSRQCLCPFFLLGLVSRRRCGWFRCWSCCVCSCCCVVCVVLCSVGVVPFLCILVVFLVWILFCSVYSVTLSRQINARKGLVRRRSVFAEPWCCRGGVV